MGGMYTFTACASRKIRGKDDGKSQNIYSSLREYVSDNFSSLSAINLAIAGCASGIALGWEGKLSL